MRKLLRWLNDAADRRRDVKAGPVSDLLYDFFYYSTVLDFMGSYFPDTLEVYKRESESSGWVWIFEQFCSLVHDADWFEVDWDRLNVGFNLWMQTNEFSYKHDFALNLIYIPVQCYGFLGMDDVWFEGDYVEDYGHCGIDVLMFMISNCNIEADHILDYDVECEQMFQVLENYKREAIYNSLVKADFGKYKPPLRWLPELAPIFVGRAGNILLDTPQDSVDDEFHSFTWGDDLERVRAAWVEAKPVVKKLKRFLNWLNDVEHLDFEERVQKMIDAVIDSFLVDVGGA